MILMEGKVSVKSALLNEKRQVHSIVLNQAKQDKDTRFIQKIAKQKNIPVQYLNREEIEALSTGKTHGGVLAYVSSRKPDDLSKVLRENQCPFLVLLEGVEDPYNLGYVMRSLTCGGCDGLILGKRDFETGESTIMKASAGAFDSLSVFYEDSLQAIKQCRNAGLKVYAAMRKDAISLYETDLKIPMLFCIGGEMRGLSSHVLNEADQNVFIPYQGDFRNALNASGAASVIAFETLRQRKYEKTEM